MGAPKQKWTAEEEAALKAGIAKHGAGKWRTILKDPEFSGVLYMRSNVDLKDKWRNMSVMANGWGSREKARMALKRMQIQPTPRQDENPKVMRMEESDEDEVDIKPLVIPTVTQQAGGPNRLDNLILEALNSLREPGGLSKTAIAAYIEEQYWAPPNFKRLLSAKLKFLTANGRLIKVKRKYMIASAPFTDRRKKPSAFLSEGMHRVSVFPTVAYQDLPTKAEIDVELAKMRNMTFEEAQIVAARALAEAEAAIAEAEQSAREAEEAEAEAREKEAFAEAAKKTLLQRNKLKPMTTTDPKRKGTEKIACRIHGEF